MAEYQSKIPSTMYLGASRFNEGDCDFKPWFQIDSNGTVYQINNWGMHM